jgi:mRNA-degrading endonuclease YafQ of YafQ-DinJ toxin-antitoxin module
MRRALIPSSAFVRASKRLSKSDRRIAESVAGALAMLADDAFQPALQTHKLKGELKGSWACSAGYDLRVVFSFIEREGKEAILLESIGTHDEVY